MTRNNQEIGSANEVLIMVPIPQEVGAAIVASAMIASEVDGDGVERHIECVDGLVFPESVVMPTPTAQEVLSEFGLSVAISDEPSRHYSAATFPYDSDGGKRRSYNSPASVTSIFTDSDGGLVLANDVTAIDLLLGGGRQVGSQFVEYSPVIRGLGVPNEDIDRYLMRIMSDRTEASKIYREQVADFWKSVRDAEVFSCLALGTQEIVDRELDESNGDGAEDPWAGRDVKDLWSDNLNIDLGLWTSYHQERGQQVMQELPYAHELLRRKDAGEIIVNYGGWIRQSGSNISDYWVICPDGSLREPDSSDGRHPKGYRGGHKVWRALDMASGELGVHYSTGSSSTPGLVSAMRDQNLIVTDEQLAAVRLIEGKHGVIPGGAGLDPDVNLRMGSVLDDFDATLRQQLPEVSLGEEPDNDIYTWLVSDHGYMLMDTAADDYMDPKGKDVRCRQRDAKIVRVIKTDNLEIELVMLHKYGTWQLVARLRNHDINSVSLERSLEAGERRESQIGRFDNGPSSDSEAIDVRSVATETPDEPLVSGPVSAVDLAALMAQFNRH